MVSGWVGVEEVQRVGSGGWVEGARGCGGLGFDNAIQESPDLRERCFDTETCPGLRELLYSTYANATDPRKRGLL